MSREPNRLEVILITAVIGATAYFGLVFLLSCKL